MKTSNFVGWDIGGAHLKVASVNAKGKVEFVEQFATPLWQGLEKLEDEFPKVVNKISRGALSHALTMTAELVDIFPNRLEGIEGLLKICEENLSKEIKLYESKQGLLKINDARKELSNIASANWHASAAFTASKAKTGLFIDIGSTTTDIIPFSNNKVIARGSDDQSRLRFDELLYTGVIRTSLMSLTRRVAFNGEWQTLAAEHFSTTADVYRILGELKDDDDLMDTADGNFKDIESSINRLARMLGTDAISSKNKDCWYQVAEYFAEKQLQMITNSVLRVLSYSLEKEQTLIGAGVGRFLIKKLAARLNLPYIEFSELFDINSELEHKCNICAPAVALAQLNRLSVIE